MPGPVKRQKRPTAKDLRKEFNPPILLHQRRKIPKPNDAGVRLQRDS